MVEKARCTGCSACAMACGAKAIRMQPDEDGFLYPQIDRTRCVDCGKCSAVCPVIAIPDKTDTATKACMIYAKDAALRSASSSGGAFSLLAQQVLDKGGVVFGCAVSDDCYGAHHIGVDSCEELEKLRGSKYIQSAMGDTLRQAKAALDRGSWVLFSGTPCQIAGLKSFLGNKPYEKLVTVDVICHGVPAPAVWENYVRELEGEHGCKVTKVSFRDKAAGWQRYSLSMEFSNGVRYSRSVTEDPYLRGFVGNLYLRPSCYRCAFKGNGYCSDITLADFWGVKQFSPEESDDRGISLAITHTESGESLAAALGEAAVIKAVPMKDAILGNSSYDKSVPNNPFRERVLREIKTKGTRTVVEKYWGNSLISKIRRKLIRLLG